MLFYLEAFRRCETLDNLEHGSHLVLGGMQSAAVYIE